MSVNNVNVIYCPVDSGTLHNEIADNLVIIASKKATIFFQEQIYLQKSTGKKDLINGI